MKVVTTQAGKGFAHEKKDQQSSRSCICPNGKVHKGSYNSFQESNNKQRHTHNQINTEKNIFFRLPAF